MTKKICDIKNYASLISLAQFNRPKHIPSDFVRVDLWGKEFGEKWEFKDYKRQAESKRYQKRLLERESLKVPELVLLPGRGSKDGTWVHKRITGQKLEPRWDKERLTPAKARKITHSANYQMEIPV
jgi:hypothetical protein